MLGDMTLVRDLLGRWRHVECDGEPQMVLNRFVVGVFALLFNCWAKPRGLVTGFPLVAPCLYLLAGALIAGHLFARRKPSVSRRLIALILDCGAASYELHIGGAATVWQFSGYLWIIFGNGFRFGSRFQMYAMLIATLGFGAMVAVTPYWSSQPAQLFGGLASLTVVPLYALALIKRLSHATRQAEEANRAKSLFLASVSHELRTPLNAVIGMGALLESSDLQPEQVQMSRTIMTAARGLLSLIDGILDLSRAEAGRMPIARGDFDLALLLNEIRGIFVAQARLKGLQVNLHVSARTPLLLHGDARKLHEILLNLVGNGMKFTETGSITIGVDAVARHDAQVWLRFEVTDTGIGIAQEAHERIFEAFTQADETVVNRFGGTGLGLALVRKSVQLLGGTLGVESTLGEGSTFWFELPLQCQSDMAGAAGGFAHLHALVLVRRPEAVAPLLGRLTDWGVTVEPVEAARPGWPDIGPRSAGLLAVVSVTPEARHRASDRSGTAGTVSFIDVWDSEIGSAPEPEAQRRYASILHPSVADAELRNVLQFISATRAQVEAPAETEQEPASRESLNLLVADDNATNRYVLETILRSGGHKVTLVSNGEQALDALFEHAFDAAVLDVNMPLMSGIDAAKTYRMVTSESELIPLIALTADATPATHDDCLDAGMAACMVKPIEPKQLLIMIDEIVGRGRAARSPQKMAADPRVTEIASHPRFRSASSPAVDFNVLARLRDLGDEAFLLEVVELFRGEAHAAFSGLRLAARNGEVTGFRTNAHALRSVAANIGAQQLFEICQPFQMTSAAELRQSSSVWLEQIEAELSRVEAQLAEYCGRRDAQASH